MIDSIYTSLHPKPPFFFSLSHLNTETTRGTIWIKIQAYEEMVPPPTLILNSPGASSILPQPQFLLLSSLHPSTLIPTSQPPSGPLIYPSYIINICNKQ